MGVQGLTSEGISISYLSLLNIQHNENMRFLRESVDISYRLIFNFEKLSVTLEIVTILQIVYFDFSLVIEALKEVSDDRKCFRMVGSVLVERTVKEVRPPLTTNCEQVKLVNRFTCIHNDKNNVYSFRHMVQQQI